MSERKKEKTEIEKLLPYFAIPQSYLRRRNADYFRRAEAVGRDIYNATMRGKIAKSKLTLGA